MDPYIITTYIYKVVDRCELCLDVYTTPERTSRPGIIWLHGGGLIMGSRQSLPAEQARRYIEAGFNVIASDYRLAPEVKIPVILEDIIDAYRWIRSQGERIGVEPTRIALLGHSAGGYLAVSGGAYLIPKPRAIVSFYGYGDISGKWASEPNQHYCQQGMISPETAYQNIGEKVVSHSSGQERLAFYLYCRQQGTWGREIVGRDYDDLELLSSRYCPIRAISSDYPPTFLLHGDQDTDVPVTESLSLIEALSKSGVPHDQMILQGYEHGFDVAGNGIRNPPVAQAFDAVIQFLKRYV